MRILVTGAAGKLGSAVWGGLLDAGHEVVGTDRRYRQGLPGKLEVADLTEEAVCYRLLEGCAGLAHIGNIPNMNFNQTPQELYRINTAMNINIFQAAADMGVDNIVFSSSVQAFAYYVYALDRDPERSICTLPYLPVDGKVPANPWNTYGLSKEAGENALRMLSRLNPEGCYTAIRFPFLATEVAEWSRWSRWWKRSRKSIHSSDEVSSFLMISDGVELIRLVLEKRLGGYHQYFAACSRLSPDAIPEALDQHYSEVPLRQANEDLRSLIDISELELKFGWAPKSSIESISAMDELAQAAE